MQNTKPVYFENLDALRFFAFLMVFIRHYFDFSNYVPSNLFEQQCTRFALSGSLGVNLFFVLSGFLITYLLIREKINLGRINIKFFYIRRALRIWPLYFLIIFLCFFVIPLATNKFSIPDVKNHLLHYILFINNFDILKTGFVGIGNDNLAILWSIAVEEQFYLIWPLLLSLVSYKYYNYVFSAVIVFCLSYRFIYAGNIFIIYFDTLSVMSDLAIGGLLAYHIYFNNAFLKFITGLKKRTTLFVYFILIIAVAFHKEWSEYNKITIVFERLFLSLLFAFVIAEQCFSTGSLFKGSRGVLLGKLGVISYGLYCLHLLSITIVQKLNIIFHINPQNTFVFYFEFFLILGITILLSHLSYRFFEGKFLKLKPRFITQPTA